MRKTKSVLFLIATLSTQVCHSQVDTLRIATYNLLKFPANNSAGRIPHFRTVIKSLQPDILIVQELQTAQGSLTFLNDVMNHGQPGVYQSAPFVNGPDTDNGLFYKPEKVDYLGANQIRTDLRNITEYVLSSHGVSFHVYSLHLKAGNTSDDESRRATEATTLRNYLNILPASFNFIVGGDFNTYRSSELALVRLSENQADNDGQLRDPINTPGNWNNNGAFAAIHTQSTRTAALDSGATGGLDDRFDQLLTSASLHSSGGMDYITGTYKSFGNDARHFNQAINFGTNTSVPDSVADALYFASDHLPVSADFVISGVVNGVDASPSTAMPSGFLLRQNHPNPFSANGQTEIRFELSVASSVRLEIFNLLGQRVAVLVDDKRAAGEHKAFWNGRLDDGHPVPGGIYFCRMEIEGASSKWSIVRKMVVL